MLPFLQRWGRGGVIGLSRCTDRTICRDERFLAAAFRGVSLKLIHPRAPYFWLLSTHPTSDSCRLRTLSLGSHLTKGFPNGLYGGTRFWAIWGFVSNVSEDSDSCLHILKRSSCISPLTDWHDHRQHPDQTLGGHEEERPLGKRLQNEIGFGLLQKPFCARHLSPSVDDICYLLAI